jgi:serine protease Do
MVDGPSPARQAGMQPGDVVLRWNGEVIGNHVDLYSLVGMTKIGSTVEAVIHRGGRELVLKVAVSERPPERPPDRPLERRR